MQAAQLTYSPDPPSLPLKLARPPRASFNGMAGDSSLLTAGLAGEPARPEGWGW